MLQIRINLLFVFLVTALEGFMAVYWFIVLEPRVMEKVQASSRRLAQSQARLFMDTLSPDRKTMHKSNVLEALDRILVVKDPSTGKLFTKGVEMEVDCNDIEQCDEKKMTFSRSNT